MCVYYKNGLNFEEVMNDPVIWKRVTKIANYNKPLEVFGEILNYPAFVSKLINLGIATVSTSYENIVNVRNATNKQAISMITKRGSLDFS